jgi:hypothetical protein
MITCKQKNTGFYSLLVGLILCLGVSIQSKETDKTFQFIENIRDQEALLKNHSIEKLRFGMAHHVAMYKLKKIGNTVVEQRSGRKRLFDHNIILKEIYLHNIIHHEAGSLGEVFQNAVFLDFGSAILFEEGAPTVRDIDEDPFIRPQLSKVIATDINDPEYEHTRYIEIYKKDRAPYPFEVEEIGYTLTSPSQISKIVDAYAMDETTPLILRSTNSGPDLFYSSDELKNHFKAILISNQYRPVLYFFNKYVYFKPQCNERFQYIGRIDEKVGVNHSAQTWKLLDWSTRTLEEAFTPNYFHLRHFSYSRLPDAEKIETSLYNNYCKIKIKRDLAFKNIETPGKQSESLFKSVISLFFSERTIKISSNP